MEIQCTSDCAYLHSSRQHPPAAQQRQRERDLQFLFPLLRELTERQHVIALLVQDFLCQERLDALVLVDSVIAEAAKALAETYETSSRGIIYEHSAGLPTAERLVSDIKQLIETRRSEGLVMGDGDVSAVLRRIETGARTAKTVLGGESTAYLQLLKRVLKDQATESGSATGAGLDGTGSSLIVPGR